MRFRLLVSLLLAVALATLASSAAAQETGGSSETVNTPETGDVGQSDEEVVVRVGLHADEKNFNPFLAPQAQPVSHDLTMLVYDTLFWSQSRLAPEPWLATGAEPSDDRRTWTVSLRDDVRWHDGEQFTADDVAFTFEYFNAHPGPGRYGRHVYQHPVFQSATVIDPTTVQLTFAGPVATFPILPGGDLPILPQHIWAGVADPRADATTLPIGTGPYRMVDYQPGSSYSLAANQDYFLGAPLVDTLALSVIPDDEAVFGALRNGELDLVARNVPVEMIEEIERNDDVDIIGATRSQSVYLMFNLAQPVLQDTRVRQGLSLGLDVHLMLDLVEGGQGRLGTDTWTHPNSPWTRDTTGAHLSDALAAGQLLDAAGFTASTDGTRVAADGQPLTLTLGVNGALPNHVRAADLVVEQLTALGVAVGVQHLDPAVINATQGGDPSNPPQVDMLIGELESHAHDGPDHLFFLFHSNSGGVGDVFGNYANPEFDALVEDALDEPAEGQSRIDLIHRAQDILAQDLPAFVLYYPAGRIAYRPDAYDGWASDQGHGVFTKRSLLAPYADLGIDSHAGPRPVVEPFRLEEEGGGGLGGFAIAGIAVVVLAAVGGAGFVAWSRFLKPKGPGAAR